MGGTGRGSLSPSSCLPPTRGSIQPHACPSPREDSVGWSPTPKALRGSPPSPKLGDALGRSPWKMPPKKPGPLGLTPPPLQAAQPSLEREGRKEGAWRCPGEPGQGGGGCQWGEHLMKS